MTAKKSPISTNDPIKKLIHECTVPGVQVAANIVGLSPSSEDDHVAYALMMTGPQAHVLAEMVVGYINTLQARQEQKIVVDEAPARLQ